MKEISELIGESVGEKPTLLEIDRYRSEGKKRYENQIPPGYIDAKDKSDNEKYGDFIIWEQMIVEAQSRSVPVIFLSDDRKKDWVNKHNGLDIGPLPELVEEFGSRTNQTFYNYSLISFLRNAKRYTKLTITDNAFSEIEEDAKLQKRLSEKKYRDSRNNMASLYYELNKLKIKHAELLEEYREFTNFSNKTETMSDIEKRDMIETYRRALINIEEEISFRSEMMKEKSIDSPSMHLREATTPSPRQIFTEVGRRGGNKIFRLSDLPISHPIDKDLEYPETDSNE